MERSEKLLNREQSVLVIVDLQETLLKTIKVGQEITNNIQLLVQVAQTLEVPTLYTTQNAEKLGGVIPKLERFVRDIPVMDKLCFSCAGSDEFMKQLQSLGRTQIILTGIEAHICIMQTALDLMKAGYTVHTPYDAIASRQKRDWKYALLRLAHSSVIVSSVESVIYEWLQEAGTDLFRSVLPLLKEREQRRTATKNEDTDEDDASETPGAPSTSETDSSE